MFCTISWEMQSQVERKIYLPDQNLDRKMIRELRKE